MTRETTPRGRLDLPQITGLGAHLLIWNYFVTISVLALLSLDDVHSAVPVWISIALFGSVWFVLTHDAQPRVGLGVSIYVSVACVVSTAISSNNSIVGGFSQWYVGAGALAMFYLSLRRRDLVAWLGFVGIAITVLLWGLSTDGRLLEAILLVARQAPYVLVGSLFSFGMRRTRHRLDDIRSIETSRAAAEAAALARTAERSRRLAGLDAAVGAQLQRIADGVELTDDDRAELVIAEARLRDSLRARQLDLPEIVSAVQRARRRGATVVLLDDRYPLPLPSAALAAVTEAAVRTLDDAVTGAVTIRLLPAGRALVATMVTDDAGFSRIEIPAP
ncbi:hypothetical protein ESZ53_07330 [Salinibacterium sp. UTAS2018]|uniref:hypothetical protein n=1 Tax=Salinibacterium sp. UTAS2018 TaxID=2508880 RepID=UPI0010098068|nr:hypothetical protein [Salinibacterium sp. UTAS2018]QAV70269.1 hypothetical protein ESZ53_07330 [Salinibacterium sp. UTAS2018]